MKYSNSSQSNSNIDEMIVDEFKDKTFRECAEIIVGNPKDKDWTDMQINQLVKLHEQAIQQLLDEAYKKGYIDGGIAEITK